MTSVEASYRECRRLSFRFGSTYFWAASVLDRQQRPYVHALYAFCRYADDIVDSPELPSSGSRAEALDAFGTRFFEDLSKGESDDAILAAVVDTVTKLQIDPDCFQRFMRSMRMDLTKTRYETFDDLMDYMDGSAAVIGEMMLPVLQPRSPNALQPARDLGVAFQLTNFLRDVGEDLKRGRVYIPQDTLQRFDVNPYDRVVDGAWRDAMRFEIDRTRQIYERAEPGIQLLPRRAARSIAAAYRLYGGILNQIEANDYDVFNRRARVPYWRKLAVLPQATVFPDRRAPAT